MAPGPSDDVLMAQVAGGDEAALRLLVERWERRLLAFFLRTLGSADDAQDFAQETFVRVHRHAAAYEGRGRFGPWLFRIAGNLARNEIRRRAVRGLLSLDWARGGRFDPDEALDRLEAPTADRPDEALARRREAARVRRALLALPDRQRVAIVLRRFEDLPVAEIAEAMGLSEGAVESLLSRGMETLRKRLARARG